MSSTRLRKLRGFVSNAYKKFLDSSKEWNIFSKVSLICIKEVEEQKVRVNDNNFVGGKSEFELSLRVSWKRKRMSSGYNFNLLRFIKRQQYTQNRG